MAFPVISHDYFYDCKAGKEKAFATALTEDGKAWILQNHVSEKGKFKDQTIYPNLSIICTKLKFDKEVLLNELNGTAEKEEPKKSKDKQVSLFDF